MEVWHLLLQWFGEYLLDDFGEIEVNFEVLPVYSLNLLYEVLHNKCQVVHEWFLGIVLNGGAHVIVIGGMGFNYSDSDEIGVFFIKVVDLNLLRDEVVVVFCFYLFAVQVDETGDDDDLLFHCDFEFALLQLPLLWNKYMRVNARNCFIADLLLCSWVVSGRFLGLIKLGDIFLSLEPLICSFLVPVEALLVLGLLLLLLTREVTT